MSRNLKLFIILILAIFIGIKFFKKEKNEQQATKDKTIKILLKKALVEEKDAAIELSAHIESKNIVKIIPQTDGIVKEILINQGSAVKNNDIILILDEKDKSAEFKRAEQLVNQKKKELDISNSLLKTGDTPIVMNNQAKTSYNDALSQLERAKNQLSFVKIKATIDGYLDKINVKKGDYVNQQLEVAKIIDNKNFIAIASIPQTKIHTIQLGQPAVIMIDENAIHGSIKFISNIADQGTRTYYSEIAIDNGDTNILTRMIGAPVQAKIIYSKIGAIKLNDSAAYIDDNGNLSLKILNNDGIVQSLPVEILDSNQKGESWFYNKEFVSGKTIDVIIRGAGFINDGGKIENVEYSD